MNRIFFTILIFLLLPHIAFAHDCSEHITDLEVWVTGIGIVLILLACIYSLWWKRPKAKSENNEDYDSFFKSHNT